MIGLKLAAIVAAGGLVVSAVTGFVAYGKGVDAERVRIMAEHYETVRQLVRSNLETRSRLDEITTKNEALGAKVEEKELEVRRLARARNELWERRANEDVGCADWFDVPVACRLRDDSDGTGGT